MSQEKNQNSITTELKNIESNYPYEKYNYKT